MRRVTTRVWALLVALCCALCLWAPAPAAQPRVPASAAVLVAQHTGGSFGGSRWGSGSSGSGSYGGSSSSGSYGGGSYGGGSSRSSRDSSDDGFILFYLVYLAFQVHPLLGIGVLVVGLLFFWLRNN